MTILIKQWRGLERTARFRLYMKHFSIPHPDPNIPLPHSTNIIHSTNELLSSKLTSANTKFIGVHLRSKQVLLREFNENTYDRCFQLFHNLTQKLSVRYSGLPVLYVGDSHTPLTFGKQMLEHNIVLTEYQNAHDEGYKAQ